ncbi:L,D-transpeptidase family protein [Streptacidiphilus sp. N1-3]|uniref:L,D-transpeptidase family protein n=1 Tax=Streptacidiphilus alkalitolerans TaxID=3342712 RepID=A0ABV6XBB7_9ACTN
MKTHTRSIVSRTAALACPALLVVALCAGCAQPGSGTVAQAVGPAPAAAPTAAAHLAGGVPSGGASAPVPAALPPGIGATLGHRVPADTNQILLVTGQGVNSPDSSAVLYERTDGVWQAHGSWATHNALHGWTEDHHDSDLRSPIGVFALTDAGGLRPDPGAKLPYHHSSGFVVTGTGFRGEPLAGAFNYVIAINYNREPGTSPLDPTRPEGYAKGGGIWLHVDHHGPTHGCVSLPSAAMVALLRTLDPAQHPVVVMGDRAALSA